MVRGYVRGGLDSIFTGSGLNHQLMALLAWAMSSVTGESEVAFRLLSVVPFAAGVVLVTAWLHRRHGALSGVLFLFLATVSPLLLDITRQARGYGLAFMAMCVVIVAALEAVRTGRTWLVVAMCAAGVIGSWTLPQFAIAFGATCVAVALDRSVRRATVVGLVASMALIYAWYAFHTGAVESASQIEDGVRIGLPWIVTAPIDQILLPALIWIDGTALVAGLVWLPLVCAVIVVAAASPLLRVRSSALVLGSGVVASILVLWVTDAYVIPRYLSFLLVPWFVMVATGAAALLSGVLQRRAPRARPLVPHRPGGSRSEVRGARTRCRRPPSRGESGRRAGNRRERDDDSRDHLHAQSRKPRLLPRETGGRARAGSPRGERVRSGCRRLLRLPAFRARPGRHLLSRPARGRASPLRAVRAGRRDERLVRAAGTTKAFPAASTAGR